MTVLTHPDPDRYRNIVIRYCAATRPAFLTVTIVAVILGLAVIYAAQGSINWFRAVITMILAVLVQAGANVLNDYHDHCNSADNLNSHLIYPFTGGRRFIQNGILTPRQTRLFACFLLLLAIPGGLWLSWICGPGLLLIGIAGFFFAWSYSAPPLQLMHKGWGEIAITASWLLTVIGTAYVQTPLFFWMPVAAGVSYALLVTAILFINQFPDYESDAAVKKCNWVVRLGPHNAAYGYFALISIAGLWLILQIGNHSLPHQSGMALISILFSLQAARQLKTFSTQPHALRPAIKLTITAALIHGLLLSLMLVLSRHQLP